MSKKRNLEMHTFIWAQLGLISRLQCEQFISDGILWIIFIFFFSPFLFVSQMQGLQLLQLIPLQFFYFFYSFIYQMRNLATHLIELGAICNSFNRRLHTNKQKHNSCTKNQIVHYYTYIGIKWSPLLLYAFDHCLRNLSFSIYEYMCI